MFALSTCTVVVEPDVGAGLGATCTFDGQCQASSCIDGLCAVRCGDSAGCPGGTVCAQGVCHVPIQAAYLFPHDLAQDEVGRSFDIGRQEADEILGYIDSSQEVPFASPGDAVARAAQVANAGAEVIVSTTPLHADRFAAFAAETPDVTVLSYQGTSSGPNLVSFDARTYQVYYLAGIAAGRYSKTRRVAILGGFVSPPVVASINAFALGARAASADPITIELRWIGEPHDTQPKVNGKSRERIFTEQMVMETGCDVVAHTLDNSIPLLTVADLIDDGRDVYAIGANLEDACAAAPAGRCLGSTYFQWGPLLAFVLDELHRDRDLPGLVLGGIEVSNLDSPIGFAVPSDLSGGVSLAALLEDERAKLAAQEGVGAIFDGPIASTGQCEAASGVSPCVPEGERLSEEGLATMCWLLDGIVDELDMPAVVPDEDRCGS